MGVGWPLLLQGLELGVSCGGICCLRDADCGRRQRAYRNKLNERNEERRRSEYNSQKELQNDGGY
jgi:hypothetical protein